MSAASLLAGFAAKLFGQQQANTGIPAFLKNGELVDAANFFEIKELTATADGQVNFPVTYSPGGAFLFYGGSFLPANAYTQSNGTNLILADGALIKNGDKLQAFCMTPFAVANALTLTGTAYDSARLGGVLAAAFAKESDRAAMPFQKPFISNWFTTTSAAGGTLPHSLGVGVFPSLVVLELKVIVAFSGLTVGQIIPISIAYDGNLRASGFWYDGTNIYYKLCSDGAVFSWVNPATGASAAIANTNVQWRLRAWA